MRWGRLTLVLSAVCGCAESATLHTSALTVLSGTQGRADVTSFAAGYAGDAALVAVVSQGKTVLQRLNVDGELVGDSIEISREFGSVKAVAGRELVGWSVTRFDFEREILIHTLIATDGSVQSTVEGGAWSERDAEDDRRVLAARLGDDHLQLLVAERKYDAGASEYKAAIALRTVAWDGSGSQDVEILPRFGVGRNQTAKELFAAELTPAGGALAWRAYDDTAGWSTHLLYLDEDGLGRGPTISLDLEVSSPLQSVATGTAGVAVSTRSEVLILDENGSVVHQDERGSRGLARSQSGYQVLRYRPGPPSVEHLSASGTLLDSCELPLHKQALRGVEPLLLLRRPENVVAWLEGETVFGDYEVTLRTVRAGPDCPEIVDSWRVPPTRFFLGEARTAWTQGGGLALFHRGAATSQAGNDVPVLMVQPLDRAGERSGQPVTLGELHVTGLLGTQETFWVKHEMGLIVLSATGGGLSSSAGDRRWMRWSSDRGWLFAWERTPDGNGVRASEVDARLEPLGDSMFLSVGSEYLQFLSLAADGKLLVIDHNGLATILDLEAGKRIHEEPLALGRLVACGVSCWLNLSEGGWERLEWDGKQLKRTALDLGPDFVPVATSEQHLLVVDSLESPLRVRLYDVRGTTLLSELELTIEGLARPHLSAAPGGFALSYEGDDSELGRATFVQLITVSEAN